MKMVKFHTGKTKTIEGLPPQIVRVSLSDNVTAGDGLSKTEVPGKGVLSSTIAVNCFKLLQRKNVPISFIAAHDSNSFFARYANPAPLEVVCRGIATGSYLKRNPNSTEGEAFSSPVVEFFYKDDANHDPFISERMGNYYLHKPDAPVGTESVLGVLNFGDSDKWHLWGRRMDDDQVSKLFSRSRNIVLEVYTILREAWGRLGFTLVDLKIEVGVCPITGEVVISDAITPDEWRLWKNGNSAERFDKDPFRKSEEKDGFKIKGLIIERYSTIAALTAKF